MNAKALIDSFTEFKDDKNIDRVTLMSILEDVFRSLLIKKYGSDENFDIIVNPDKGDLEIWHNRIVVPDGEVEDPSSEISLSDAQKIEPDFEVDEDVSEEVKIEDFGRRMILAIRQNLIARIHEHDNGNLYKRYKDLEGEIVTGEVHHIRHREIIIYDDEQNELLLPREHQIPSDFFRKGDAIRAVVESVDLRGTKPLIKLSRTSPKFLEKMFEQEIPEVFDGLITVRRVVRIPGEKAKVAVESYDDRIDPVGACVGMKGSRIHGIVRELRNENIDVINFTNNETLFIQRALSPAKISNIALNEETKKAEVSLDPEEVSKAIGKKGYNIRLASQLTGYEIEVYRDIEEEEDIELQEFSDEIEQWILDEFHRIGLDTARSVLEQEIADLIKRTELEEETVKDVIAILRSEFEEAE
jgi:N utilization substance protein A